MIGPGLNPNAGSQAKKSVALSGVVAGNTACARSAAPATTCTTAATTSSSWQNTANSRRSPTCWSTAPAQLRRAAAVQAAPACATGPAECRAHGPRMPAGGDPSDGRAAHRRLGARRSAARARGPPGSPRRARSPTGCWRPSARCCSTGTTTATTGGASSRDRRRLHRRAFPALLHGKPPSAMGPGDAYLADPLRRARIQRLDLYRARHRRHRFGHVFGITGAIGACAAPSTAAPTRSPTRSRSATATPTRPRPTSASARRARK
jgi:hypothetical protein